MIRSQIAPHVPGLTRSDGQVSLRRALKMAFLWALLTLALHLCPGVVDPTRAQGTRKDDIVFNSRGIPLAGATVRVCAMPASGQPCTPLALLYSDPALTQAIANPTTTDGLGNYFFYAAPGKYEIEISGPGITTKQLPNVILPNDPASPTFTGAISAFSLSLSGNLSVTGNTSGHRLARQRHAQPHQPRLAARLSQSQAPSISTPSPPTSASTTKTNSAPRSAPSPAPAARRPTSSTPSPHSKISIPMSRPRDPTPISVSRATADTAAPLPRRHPPRARSAPAAPRSRWPPRRTSRTGRESLSTKRAQPPPSRRPAHPQSRRPTCSTARPPITIAPSPKTAAAA